MEVSLSDIESEVQKSARSSASQSKSGSDATVDKKERVDEGPIEWKDGSSEWKDPSSPMRAPPPKPDPLTLTDV